jgi:hypothetical protein
MMKLILPQVELRDMMKLIFLLFLFCAACGAIHTPAPSGAKLSASDPSKASPSQSDIQDPNLLCNRISEIKIYPFKGERGEDATYDALIEAGDKVVPCLIGKITDTTKMPDPRQEPKFSDIRVGDIAYFILIDITRLDFTEFLPPAVKEKYKDEGVYAYFRHVEKQENRRRLQSKFYEWYHQKYGKDAYQQAQ